MNHKSLKNQNTLVRRIQSESEDMGDEAPVFRSICFPPITIGEYIRKQALRSYDLGIELVDQLRDALTHEDEELRQFFYDEGFHFNFYNWDNWKA